MPDTYKLTDYGTELVEAMPDKKAMAAVKRKYLKKAKTKKAKEDIKNG